MVKKGKEIESEFEFEFDEKVNGDVVELLMLIKIQVYCVVWVIDVLMQILD